MNIAQALREAVALEKWPPARLGFEAGVSEVSARSWLSGRSLPTSERLEILRAKMPSLRQILDAQTETIRIEFSHAA